DIGSLTPRLAQSEDAKLLIPPQLAATAGKAPAMRQVQLQCPKNHWAVYSDPNTPSGPHLLSQDAIQQITDLHTLYKPQDAVARVDAFAKWLFGGTATVAGLAVA